MAIRFNNITITNNIVVGDAEIPAVISANFTGTPLSGAVPLTVSFTANTVGTINEYKWDFGDGAGVINTSANPTRIFTSVGFYTISLTVSGPAGTDTTAKSSYVQSNPPAPTVNFVGTPTSGITPVTAQFSAITTGTVTEWLWNFGDGAGVINTSANPVRIFTSVGFYNISLTVSGPEGNATSSKSSYIQVKTFVTAPAANFTASPLLGVAPQTVVFTNTTSGGSFTESRWDFQNDGTDDSTLTNPSFTYTTHGTYSVKLTVSGPGGSDTITKTSYITIASANGSGVWTAWNGTQVREEYELVTDDIVNNSAHGYGGFRSISMNDDVIVFNNVGGNTLKAYSLRVTGNVISLLNTTTIATNVRERLFMPIHSIAAGTSSTFYLGYMENSNGYNMVIRSYNYNSDGTLSLNFSTTVSAVGGVTINPATFGMSMTDNNSIIMGGIFPPTNTPNRVLFRTSLSATGIGNIYSVSGGSGITSSDGQGSDYQGVVRAVPLGTNKVMMTGPRGAAGQMLINLSAATTVSNPPSTATGSHWAPISGGGTFFNNSQITMGRIDGARIILFYNAGSDNIRYMVIAPGVNVPPTAAANSRVIATGTPNISSVDTCFVGDRCWFTVFGSRVDTKLRAGVVQLDTALSGVNAETGFFDIVSGTQYKYVTCQTIGTGASNIRNRAIVLYTKGTGATLSLFGRIIRMD